MIGFFYVRKPIESKKLSRDFAELNIGATGYPSKGTHVHWMNRRRDVQELFQMDAPRKRSIKIELLANQLIHSYIFYLSIDEFGPLRGILVASDHVRNDELLEVSINDILKVFDIAAKGEADKALLIKFDAKRQDYVVRLAKDLSDPSNS